MNTRQMRMLLSILTTGAGLNMNITVGTNTRAAAFGMVASGEIAESLQRTARFNSDDEH
jgi:hypothetical protein